AKRAPDRPLIFHAEDDPHGAIENDVQDELGRQREQLLAFCEFRDQMNQRSKRDDDDKQPAHRQAEKQSEVGVSPEWLLPRSFRRGGIGNSVVEWLVVVQATFSGWMSFFNDAAVWLLRLCMISSGVPVATMYPPSSPPSGPKSMI